MSLGLNTQGVGSLTAVGAATVIAAPGDGKRLHIQRVVVSCETNSLTGTLALGDGTTTFWKVQPKDGNGNQWIIDFGEKGYYLEKNAALTLTNATANISAIASAIGYIR